MTRPTIRFQVLCLPDVPWADLRERFVRAEALGFESAALADHFVDWTDPTRPWFESWTALTGLAGATSTIRLATGVTQIPLRNPAMFARQAMTLDHVSGGRLEIGLGTGLVGDPSYAMIGVPDWDAKERVAHFGEYVRIVDGLLRDRTLSFAGEHYRVEGATMHPGPVQSPRPPITIAGLGPVMMRHVARYADTWSSLSFKSDVDEQLAETSERVSRMDEACVALDRDPGTLRRSYLLYDGQARRRGGRYDYYASVDAFETLAGRVLELGMDELCLYFPPDPSQWPVFERIATDVLPRLRSR